MTETRNNQRLANAITSALNSPANHLFHEVAVLLNNKDQQATVRVYCDSSLITVNIFRKRSRSYTFETIEETIDFLTSRKFDTMYTSFSTLYDDQPVIFTDPSTELTYDEFITSIPSLAKYMTDGYTSQASISDICETAFKEAHIPYLRELHFNSINYLIQNHRIKITDTSITVTESDDLSKELNIK